MGFIVSTIYYLALIVNPTQHVEFWFVDFFLEIISRFFPTLSAIGCMISFAAERSRLLHTDAHFQHHEQQRCVWGDRKYVEGISQ